MKDKERLLRDLLKLGVCFRTRLTENDLGVYAEMIDQQLSDPQWLYAFDHFTGNWTDPGDAPKFMPTPQELIAIGRSIGRAPETATALTEEQVEFRRRYQEQASRQRLEAAANREPMGHGALLDRLLKSMDEVSKKALPMSEDEWEARRRILVAQADELLHEGECPK